MNLLVTGGAGFIGSNLIRQLISKSEINCLVNLDCLTYAGCLAGLEDLDTDPRYRFEKVDLRDKEAVFDVVKRHSITHVMHLAAESHVDRSISGPDAFITTNVLGTFNLLEACRDQWRQGREHRFLHVSTDEVYGSLGSEGLFTEESPYKPNSPYSASKAGSDLLVRAYVSTYGFPALVTNCSNNYGPRQFPEKLIPVVILNLLARKPIPVYGDGGNIRDWLHVDDHAKALWSVLIQGEIGGVYNIGSNNEWNNLELVKEICRAFDDLYPERGGDSHRLIQFVTDRLGHDRRYAIDAAKITKELGWNPEISFVEGLKQTITWYVKNPDWIDSARGQLGQK